MKLQKGDYGNLTDLFKELFRVSGAKVIVSFVLQILTGFTQGIGLLMLIPLLSIVGIFDTQAKASGFVASTIAFIQNTGLPQGIVSILFFYILIVSLSAWLNSYQTIINAKIQQRFVRYLKDKLYTSLGHSQWLFVSRLRMSDVAHIITSEVQQAGQVIFQVLRFSATLITMFVYIGVAFLLSAQMAFLSLFGALILLAIGQQKNKYAYNLGKSSQHSVKKVYHIVFEFLVGMKVAKSFAGEDKYIQEFIFHSEEVENRKLDYVRLSSRTSLMFSIGTVILLSLYVYLAIEVVHLPVSTLLVLIYLFSKLLPKVSSLQSAFQSVLQALPAFTSVSGLQNECDRYPEALLRDAAPERLDGTIELKNVSFGYGSQPVFENLSLRIPSNSILCITGESGIGKTTLADLILGLLRPTAGGIYIDGKQLNDEILYSWRKSIAYVMQESFLFNDSIRNNLLWTKPDAAEDELWEALEKSAATEMVKKMASGLDTLVGDRGAQLSGGERQRLALARALVRRPTLLIMDEATNALDTNNETKIIEALYRLKGTTTMIIISHNEAIHSIADKVVYIGNGGVVHGA